MSSNLASLAPGQLVLADGTAFEGEIFGAQPADGVAVGEVVFNTVLSGYQEVITDPSYAGQIVAFTYPHFGNYGANEVDNESRQPFLRGVVTRDVVDLHSNWRATESIEQFLYRSGISGISGVDTRRLTRHIRSEGAMNGAFGSATEAHLASVAAAAPSTEGVDLVATVSCDSPYRVPSLGALTPWRVVTLDFGVKTTMLRRLREIAEVIVVPASTSASQIGQLNPHGIFLPNGPGDPEAVEGAVQTVRELLGTVPIFGICLGHQLLSLALGLEVFKLAFGHHGGNHPVRNLATNRVEITSQNHNFCVADSAAPGVEITHINLNDHTIEGVQSSEVPAFGVQYHPEAGPGPHDSRYLFAQFQDMLTEFHGTT